jgi:hypothetical protein
MPNLKNHIHLFSIPAKNTWWIMKLTEKKRILYTTGKQENRIRVNQRNNIKNQILNQTKWETYYTLLP